uniref:Uncharacterized protein n=1 Tax=Astyanax mexicanus TaxID=7994 RepID=A0A8B9K5A3_ASTMX
MQKVSTVAECDVILCFCPVVSRAGTDIEAALNKLDNESGNKPVVLVVLIHTLNPEDIVPDSSKSVNRENTLTVDCLFHEDQQLWKCNTNYDAIDKVTEYLKPKVFYSVLCQVYSSAAGVFKHCVRNTYLAAPPCRYEVRDGSLGSCLSYLYCTCIVL